MSQVHAQTSVTARAPKVRNQTEFGTPVSSNGMTSVHFNSIDGLRRSLRCNIPGHDGTYLSDTTVLHKAMQRAATYNLDSEEGSKTMAPTSQGPYSPSIPVALDNGTSIVNHFFSIANMPDDNCVANLDSLGFRMKKSSSRVNLSIKALKQVDIDRIKLDQSNKQKAARSAILENREVNPFDSSDDEATDLDGDLLAHLIKDVSEVDLEMEDLDMKICDLKASSRKSSKNKNQKNLRKGLT